MAHTGEFGIYEVPSTTGELPDVLHVAGRGSFAPVQFMVVLRPEVWDVIVRGPLVPRSPADSRQWGWLSWQGGLPQRVQEIVASEARLEIERLETVIEGLRAGITLMMPPTHSRLTTGA